MKSSLELNNAVNIAKFIMKEKVNSEDIVVDATMGNGNDTLLLAQLVGDKGKVYAFDYQSKALHATSRLLKLNNQDGVVELVQDGHEKMDIYVQEKVKAVIFNLGYLPGCPAGLKTQGKSTCTALQKAAELLVPSGFIAVVAYTGHDGGTEELEAVEAFCETLNQKEYLSFKINYLNQVNGPPQLIYIEKK
jgi:predicted methyltransferase